MIYIELKTDPKPWQDVFDNEKKVEIRRDDRKYDVGVTLVLAETKHTGEEMAAGADLIYTGRKCKRIVTHCLRGEQYGVREGFVALSVRRLTKAEKEAKQ